MSGVGGWVDCVNYCGGLRGVLICCLCVVVESSFVWCCCLLVIWVLFVGERCLCVCGVCFGVV